MSQVDNCIEDIVTPKNTQLSARYKRSFAYVTFQVRIPVILTKIIDHLVKDKDEIIRHHGEKSREEIKEVIGLLSKLKTDVQTNKKFEILKSNGSDVSNWNAFLNSFSPPLDFYTSCFLYAECYTYRRVREAFELTSSLREFDYFQKQKDESLIQAQFAIKTIAKHISQTKKSISHNNDLLRNEFCKLLKLCLWGNRCDLSISAGSDNAQTTDPIASLTELENKTIADDSLALWAYLENIQKAQGCKCQETIIDFVTDNAGYEFFMDLCLADFLLEHKFAYQIRFLVKAIPWYISDVTSKDFHHVINNLQHHTDEDISSLGKRLSNYVEQQKFLLIVDDFWTSPYEFCKMQEKAKALYDKLSEAALVIFKGDLNHRKLIHDINWIDTEIKTALQGFLPTTICTLRTIKCDLVAGIDKNTYEGLCEKYGGEEWMTTGEYAVIQCAFKQ